MENTNTYEDQTVNDRTQITPAFTAGQVNISKSTQLLFAGQEFSPSNNWVQMSVLSFSAGIA